MMTQYYFSLTNPDAEALLKEEIKLRYPELNLSYSRPGFLTFKSEDNIFFKPLFARISGQSLGRFTFRDLNFTKAWVWKQNENLEIPSSLREISDKTLYKHGEMVTLIMMLGADEFWVGVYPLESHHFQTPGEVSSILEKDAPSRSYYKMAEAFEAFDLPFDHEERVLELGAAPGGASLFLLEQDTKVLGVDTADMDPRILKYFNFKHLRRPFETLTENDFSDNVDWIVSDLNLPPTVVLREVYRLLSFLEPRGLILTLAMNQLQYIDVLATVREKFRQRGFKKVELKYLPSHKQEILLIALRS